MKISGPAAIVTFLYVFIIFGSLHLLALSLPNNKVARAYLGAGF